MRCGQIYYFTTKKAVGHAERNKYHLYVGPAGQYDDGDRLFLFISKSNSYGDGFEIRQAEGYDFLRLEFSFISCSSTVAYFDDELTDWLGEPVGELREEDVPLLIRHLEASEVLEDRNIVAICKALRQIQRIVITHPSPLAVR